MAGFAALGQDAALLQHSSRGAAFGYQLAAVAVTVAIGAAGGTLGGFLVTAFDPVDQKLTAAQLFEDGTFWTVRATQLGSASQPGCTNADVRPCGAGAQSVAPFSERTAISPMTVILALQMCDYQLHSNSNAACALQDVDVEALPLDAADSSRHSTVHRGAARVWADASHSLHAGRSEHGAFGRAGGSAQGSPARPKKAEGVVAEPGVRQPGWPS